MAGHSSFARRSAREAERCRPRCDEKRAYARRTPACVTASHAGAIAMREAIGDAWRGSYAVTDPREPAPLPAPDSAAAFVITGSAANVPHREPWMLRAEARREVLEAE